MWSIRRSGTVLLLLAAVGVTACGATAETGAGQSQSITASTGVAASTSTPTVSAPVSTSAPTISAVSSTGAPSSSVSSPARTSLFGSTVGQKPGPELRLTGTVEAGVEPSCLLLTDEKTGRRLNITGGDKRVIKVGARITVVGQIRTDLRSYCQQGAIFQVRTATVA